MSLFPNEDILTKEEIKSWKSMQMVCMLITENYLWIC